MTAPEPSGELLPAMPRGVFTYESPCGDVRVYFDTEAEDFHMDASPDADSALIGLVLDTVLHARGIELIPEEEDEPFMLDDGFIRIYARPVIPVEIEESPSTKRVWGGITTSAIGIAGASLVLNALSKIHPIVEVLT